MLEHVPPQNIEAESAVLGCTLLDMDGALTAVQALEPDHFYRPAHQLIFAAIVALTTRGVQPDIILVAEELGETLEQCGGREALHGLMTVVPSSANVDQYIEIVKDAAARRQLIMLATQTLQDVETAPVCEVTGNLIHGLQALNSGERQWQTTIEVLSVNENAERFNTGLECLDRMTGGIRAGLTLIGGKPGAGKTTLCLQIILRALQAGHKVGILGADQLKSDQARIIWSNLAGVRIESLREDEDWETHKTLTEWPLLWYGGAFSLSAVCAAMRSQVMQGRTFFVVDSLQMVSVPGQEKEQDKANEAARELKRLANELSIFLLLTCEYTKLGGAKASMENMRGGAPVTHAAGQVWWLDPQEPDRFTGKKKVTLTVFKNQLGVADTHEVLTYDGGIHRFTDEGDLPEGV